MLLKHLEPDPDRSNHLVRIRLSTFYFTLMTTSAVATPYLGLWLSTKGLTAQEIGLANALPLLSLMLLNMLAGRLADLAGDWRRTIHIGVVIGCVTPLLLFASDKNWALLVAWTLVVLPINLVIPVTDAASVAVSGQNGEAYSRIRVWGTIGHMAATFAAGLAVDRFGVGTFPMLIVAIALLRLSMALLLPPLRPRTSEAASLSAEGRRAEVAKQLFDMTRPWFLLTLVGSGFINASHMLQNSFGAIFWHEAGLTAGQIAILWVAATAAEIAIMFAFRRLAGRHPARVMLLAAGMVSIIRWIGFGLTNSFPVLLVLQVLHFATFGLSYLATVAFIANRARHTAAASAQSLLSIIRQITSVLALVAFGYAAGHMGAASYHLAAGLALLGCAAIVLSLVMLPPSQTGRLS